MRTNLLSAPRSQARTHAGARAAAATPLQELQRATLTSLLWEDLFYEKGSAHAARVASLVETLVKQGNAHEVASLARQARDSMFLRHMPLFLCRELARHSKTYQTGPLVLETLYHVIQRADELTEYLALYWKDKREPISAASKKALARAFGKFNEYQLAKYDRDGAVKLRDVLRLVRPKPQNADQAALFGRVRKGTMTTPDTWETELSAGKDKKATFERLLSERKLGALAFLRNLRNMTQAGVDPLLIRDRFHGKFEKVLPFRFLAAAKHATQYIPSIEEAMLRSAAELPKLPGRTILLVDVSGSMDAALSGKSDLLRLEAASALAILLREVCESARVFTFSEHLAEVKPLQGFALNDAIVRSQPHASTYLGNAVKILNKETADRLIVVTDEQSHDTVPDPNFQWPYMINVASYERGVAYETWARISGWSEKVLDFIQNYENEG